MAGFKEELERLTSGSPPRDNASAAWPRGPRRNFKGASRAMLKIYRLRSAAPLP